MLLYVVSVLEDIAGGAGRNFKVVDIAARNFKERKRCIFMMSILNK